MTSFDLTDPLAVLTATVWGEARGCGRAAMENVASCIMNRVAAGWAADVVHVCLAPMQFSAWDANDPNRADIFIAATKVPLEPSWTIAKLVAAVALADAGPRRIGLADSYYALSMLKPPFWAKAPATHVCSDGWHSYWLTRTPPHAPNRSVNSETADDLNEIELNNLGDA